MEAYTIKNIKNKKENDINKVKVEFVSGIKTATVTLEGKGKLKMPAAVL